MEGIKQLILGLAISSVLGALVIIFAPNGNLSRTIRIAVSLFLIAMIIIPASNIAKSGSFSTEMPDYSQDDIDTSEIQSTLEEQIKKKTEKSVEEVVSECGASNAEIIVSTSETDSKISIDSVKVILPIQYMSIYNKIEKNIYSKLGIKADVGSE